MRQAWRVGVWWCVLGCGGTPPGPVGRVEARGGQLEGCAGAACVSSVEPADDGRFVAPLAVGADRQLAMIALRRAAVSLPDATLAALGPDYLRVEYRPGWGQVDDLELALDAAAPVAAVRAGRRGPWPDGGANRARVEALRAALGGAGGSGQPAGSR